MRERSWKDVTRLQAAGAEQEAAAADHSCPCVCLQQMASALDLASLEDALLQAQECLKNVMGSVVLSFYRRVPGEEGCCLVATGWTPDEALLRARLPLTPGSMALAVLQDGIVRRAPSALPGEGPVVMVPVVGRPAVEGLLIAECGEEKTGCGGQAAVCLRCAAAVLHIVSARSSLAHSGDRHAQMVRWKAVTELSVQVTHDINNMLQGVLGNAALARMDLPGDGPAAEALTSIEEAAKRASVLARKLLNVACDDAPDSTGCDAVKAVSDTMDLAALLYLKGTAIERSVPGTAVPVRMRENDLQTVVLACVKAGLLRLNPIAEASFSLTADAVGATLSLRLRGMEQCGSAGSYLQELTAAARACASHGGGSLDLADQPGLCTATLTIPLQLQHLPEATTGPSPLSGLRLLVVEAAPSPLPMVLRAAGCNVQAVEGWEKAGTLVRGGGISAIIAMAENGEELRAAAEGRRRLGLPVIAACLTALSCSSEVAGSLDGVIGLPLDLDHLRQLLQQVLH